MGCCLCRTRGRGCQYMGDRPGADHDDAGGSGGDVVPEAVVPRGGGGVAVEPVRDGAEPLPERGGGVEPEPDQRGVLGVVPRHGEVPERWSVELRVSRHGVLRCSAHHGVRLFVHIILVPARPATGLLPLPL